MVSIPTSDIDYKEYILSTSQQRAFIIWCNSLFLGEGSSNGTLENFPQLKNYEIESYEKLSDPLVLMNIIDMLFIWGNYNEWLRKSHDFWNTVKLHSHPAIKTGIPSKTSTFKNFLEINSRGLGARESRNRFAQMSKKSSPSNCLRSPHTSSQGSFNESLKGSLPNSSTLSRTRLSWDDFVDKNDELSPDYLNRDLQYRFHSPPRIYQESHPRKGQSSPMSISDLHPEAEKKINDWRHILFILRGFYQMKKNDCYLRRVLQALEQCEDILYNDNVGKDEAATEESFLSEHSLLDDSNSSIISHSMRKAMAISIIIYLIIGTIPLLDQSEIVESILSLDRTVMNNLHMLMKTSMKLFEIHLGDEVLDEEESRVEHMQHIRRSRSLSVLDRLERSFSNDMNIYTKSNGTISKGTISRPPFTRSVTSPSSFYSSPRHSLDEAASEISYPNYNFHQYRDHDFETVTRDMTERNEIEGELNLSAISSVISPKRTPRTPPSSKKPEPEKSTFTKPPYSPSKSFTNKSEYLRKQRENALNQELSIMEENKILRDHLWNLNQKHQALLKEHDELKESYDAVIDDVETQVENRFRNRSGPIDSAAAGRVFSATSRVFDTSPGTSRPHLGPSFSTSRLDLYKSREETSHSSVSRYMETISDLEDRLAQLQNKLNSTTESNVHQSTEITILKSRLKEKDEEYKEIHVLRERCHELMKYKNECKLLEERMQVLERENRLKYSDEERLRKQRERELSLTRSHMQDLTQQNLVLESENLNLFQQLEQLRQQLQVKVLETSSEPQIVVLESDKVGYINNDVETSDSSTEAYQRDHRAQDLQPSKMKPKTCSQSIQTEPSDLILIDFEAHEFTPSNLLSAFAPIDDSKIQNLNAKKAQQLSEIDSILEEALKL